MRKRTISEMATRFLRGRYGPGATFGRREIIRDFAKWLTSEQKKVPALPMTVVIRKGCDVQIGEHQGRVEVVFRKDGQMIRLLGDKDGIHIGTIYSGK